MAIQLEARRLRLEALYQSIKKHKSVSLMEVRRQSSMEWGLTEKTINEYIRTLELKPDIKVMDGKIFYKNE